MSDDWAELYRGLLAEITGRGADRAGFPLRAIEAAEQRLGVQLPTPLRTYYLSVGRHPLNQAHNRLIAPDAMELTDDRLVFMKENQGVLYWGVPSRGRAADPAVVQTSDLDEPE